MKRVFFKTGVTVANGSGAVEADTISKNGRNSKSHTSRRILFIGMAICVVLSACSSSSPEKDGIKAAKKICDCRDDMPEIAIKATESYIKNFNFNTRIEAREKLNEMQQKVEADYRECINNANAYRDELKSKYITNQENVEKFDYAYNAHINAFVPKPPPSRYEGVDFQSQIENLIKSIMPPKPDLERLKKDLIGRAITNQTAGYSNWNISSTDELKELQILNATENGDDYFIDTRMHLQGAANQWNINIRVKYTLGHNDDWRMNIVENNMNIVRTGKYDKCIQTELFNYKGGIYSMTDYSGIRFKNSCNEALLVSGVANGEHKFQIVVNASGTNEFRGSGVNMNAMMDVNRYYNWTVKEFVINMIEQSGM